MVSVFLAEGFEEIEALIVVDLLRRAQIETKMVSVTGNRQVMGSHQITVIADHLLDEILFEQIEMIVLPGGMPGTKNLEECDRLMEELDIAYREGKWIAAICAAPSILGHRGMLEGKRACSYPTFENHLEGAAVLDCAAVCDGNIITGRGMGCANDFSLKIIENLVGKDAAQKVAEAVIYRYYCLEDR